MCMSRPFQFAARPTLIRDVEFHWHLFISYYTLSSIKYYSRSLSKSAKIPEVSLAIKRCNKQRRRHLLTSLLFLLHVLPTNMCTYLLPTYMYDMLIHVLMNHKYVRHLTCCSLFVTCTTTANTTLIKSENRSQVKNHQKHFPRKKVPK